MDYEDALLECIFIEILHYMSAFLPNILLQTVGDLLFQLVNVALSKSFVFLRCGTFQYAGGVVWTLGYWEVLAYSGSSFDADWLI